MLKSGFASNGGTIGGRAGDDSLLKWPVAKETARTRGASVESKGELVAAPV